MLKGRDVAGNKGMILERELATVSTKESGVFGLPDAEVFMSWRHVVM